MEEKSPAKDSLKIMVQKIKQKSVLALKKSNRRKCIKHLSQDEQKVKGFFKIFFLT